MKYSNEIFEEAKTIIKKRKRDAELKGEYKKAEFFRTCPEARKVSEKIGSTGSRAAMAVIRGGDVKEYLEKLKAENLSLQEEFNSLLIQNGLSKEDISPSYFCKNCNDTGYKDNKICSCLSSLLKKITFDKLNQTSPLSLSSFDSFSFELLDSLPQNEKQKMNNIFNFCRSYAHDFSIKSNSLLFTGGTGLGKTHLSLAIAGKAIEKGFGVVYGSVQNFASAIERERFRAEEESGTDNLLSEAELIILDDLGTEFPSPYVSSVIYNIVDTRIMRNLPTIISTNLSLSEIQNRYGERLSSRIFGYFDKLDFVGTDIRILKKRMNIK